MVASSSARLARRSRPPGYPVHLERAVVTGEETFRVRPIVAADAVQLAEEFSKADAETLRLRFLSPKPKLTAVDFERLAGVDYSRRLALTAWAGAEPAAIARYEPVSDDVAEVAFVVKPHHRAKGLGRALIDMLAAEAPRHGYRELEALYLEENAAAAAALAGAGFEVRSVESGVVEAVRKLTD